MGFFTVSKGEESALGGVSARSLVYGVLGGGGVAWLAVFLYFLFFAEHNPAVLVALAVAAGIVLQAFATGPVALANILMGVRGSYHAFVGVTSLIIFAAFVYIQLKYLPRRFLIPLVAFDTVIFFGLLWRARILLL